MNIKNIKTLEELKLLKHKFYNENEELLKLKLQIKNSIDPDKKKQLGIKLHDLLTKTEKLFIEKANELKEQKINEKINNEFVDLTEPITLKGSLHPLTLITNRFKEFLISRGFYEIQGSIIVNDQWNFENLNMPAGHPSREMHDSLYIDNSTLLRTHNTSTTIVELSKRQNEEFACFAIGPVFRNDDDDATHSHQFEQIDLIATGKKVNFSNLLSLIHQLLNYVFEQELEIRFRPSYFPFTEPSVEVDIYWNNKWIEVLGAGIFNEKVMQKTKFNSDFNCLAAGIGIDRITMIKYKIDDIRDLYGNDFRFLEQYKGIN